jgi:hypothetical protein
VIFLEIQLTKSLCKCEPAPRRLLCVYFPFGAHAGRRFRTLSHKKTPRAHTQYRNIQECAEWRMGTLGTHARTGESQRRIGSESEWRSLQIIYKNRFFLCALYGRLQCKQHYPWPPCASFSIYNVVIKRYDPEHVRSPRKYNIAKANHTVKIVPIDLPRELQSSLTSHNSHCITRLDTDFRAFSLP